MRGFLCLDDPPGPFDSLDESKVRADYPTVPYFGGVLESVTALSRSVAGLLRDPGRDEPSAAEGAAG